MEFVFTAKQMREADRKSIERLNGNGLLLMEHASAACVHVLFELFGRDLREMQIVILAGRGNNGGDGMAIARQLASRAVPVSTIVLGDMDQMSDDTCTQRDMLKNYDVPFANDTAGLSPDSKSKICGADLVVDAMLGTGLNSSPRGIFEETIDLLNECGGFVLSVDIPSGLDSDCGVPPGKAVCADLTVTFGKLKCCHVLSPACLNCGEIVLDDITIPEDVFEAVGSQFFLVDQDDIVSRLPDLPPAGHKGDFGHVLVTGGTAGRLGASVMAGRAALLSGAGLATVHIHRGDYQIAGPMAPELMFFISDKPYSQTVLCEALEGKNVLLTGPGFGTSESAHDAIKMLFSVSRISAVLDADIFRMFNVDELGNMLGGRPAILTPHPGEMASLHGTTVSEVQRDRVGFAVQTATRTGAVTVLKGHRTVIGAPDGKAYVNPTGNAGLATAGSGDILSGIIASFLGQGLSPISAAICGAYVHGRAGESAGEKLTMRGVTAPAILDEIPEVLRKTLEQAI